MERQQVGLLVPSSNITMEVDFYLNLPPQITLHTARMFLEGTTVRAEEKMLDVYFPQALQQLKSMNPHLVVFGCTSAGALRGNEYEEELLQKIEDQTESPAISVIKAVREELKKHQPQNLLVLTPYVDELNARIKQSLVEDGIKVNRIKGMNISHNYSIGLVKPAKIRDFVLQEALMGTYDTIFISCTNFRAYEISEVLQEELRIPVITSNQAAVNKAISILH